jgi:RNA polymerase sigma factor (sigma-70 family)
MVDIDKLRNGEANEFKKLTLMLSVKVLNLAYHLTGNKEDAEDITQEVFLAVFNGLPNFKGASEISTWIYSITVNKCKEKTRRDLRQKRKGFHVPLEKVDFFLSAQNTDAVLINGEEETRMRNILPENQRIAFTMFTMEDFTYLEIAQSMNLSISAVESLLFRARVNLKKIINVNSIN